MIFDVEAMDRTVLPSNRFPIKCLSQHRQEEVVVAGVERKFESRHQFLDMLYFIHESS